MSDAPRLREEEFMRVYEGHKQAKFEVLLTDGATITGHVAEADMAPGDPPRKNRLFLCATWPYDGNPQTDPQVTKISFDRIHSVRRLDA